MKLHFKLACVFPPYREGCIPTSWYINQLEIETAGEHSTVVRELNTMYNFHRLKQTRGSPVSLTQFINILYGEYNKTALQSETVFFIFLHQLQAERKGNHTFWTCNTDGSAS